MNNSHTPHTETHQLTRGIDLSFFRPVNSRVLCKQLTKNAKGETRGGIIYPESFNKNQYLYQNADVVYEVVKVPKVVREQRLSRWKTKMEIQPGDIVWVTRRSALNSPDIIDNEGNEYRLIDYHYLIVAKRKGETIPLNGWCLMSNVYTQKMGLKNKKIIQEPRIIYALACVDYFGEPNLSYKTGETDDDVELQKGMVVVIDLPNKNDKSVNRAYLEESMFARFHEKKRFFYEQRRSIMGIIENDDSEK